MEVGATLDTLKQSTAAGMKGKSSSYTLLYLFLYSLSKETFHTEKKDTVTIAVPLHYLRYFALMDQNYFLNFVSALK